MDSLCPLIILDHLYVSQVKFYSFLYPLSIMTKGGRKCGFFLRFYILGGGNTCFCKGDLCFNLLERVITSFVVIGASFSLLYTGLVTIFTYIVFIFDIYMMMYVFFTYLYMCCFFSIFICMFVYVCNLYLCFTHDALMSFV